MNVSLCAKWGQRSSNIDAVLPKQKQNATRHSLGHFGGRVDSQVLD